MRARRACRTARRGGEVRQRDRPRPITYKPLTVPYDALQNHRLAIWSDIILCDTIQRSLS